MRSWACSGLRSPIQPYQRDSHIRLAQQLDIAIAVGENYFTRHQFYDIIKAGCADIIQPDNRRAGGVTEWLDIGTMCDVTGLRLASHGGGPGNVNVLCALESAIYIESGSLKGDEGFYAHPMKLRDGCSVYARRRRAWELTLSRNTSGAIASTDTRCFSIEN